jgi:TRAP-type mannitol/chloroaromatic compound transport system permease large subunit
MRKEIWFGLSILAAILVGLFVLMPAPADMTNGHLGLLMLALIVVAIMLGFPTAFTLMGMGVMFAWFAFNSRDPDLAVQMTLDLMVQRAYSVMANDVLISVPLFIFMGYLVERANLVERLFKSLHIAMARVPGSLAIATIVTCAIFATATGIVGAVVTLMGLLAFPAMLKAGYSTQLSAGAITAGGCLGILIPPSVLLIVYGATAGVSVVQLYAGAFFPGLMLATLYIGYVLLLAKLKPATAPSLSEEQRRVTLPEFARSISTAITNKAIPGLVGALKGKRNADVPARTLVSHLFVALLPALAFALVMGLSYSSLTTPDEAPPELTELGFAQDLNTWSSYDGGLEEPVDEGALEEPAGDDNAAMAQAATAEEGDAGDEAATDAATDNAKPAPTNFWITLAVGLAALVLFYVYFTFARLEIFKMLLGSLFPLMFMILAVLGSIVFGLATPTEAAAMGALGGMVLAFAYRRVNFAMLKESAYLATKTSAMVCWLFVGSSIFSAAFALLGGQELINNWVLSMDLTPLQFMIMAQIIIFLLGWPLEWTEIIVIFMPIFIPLLGHFDIDPLFFGLLVAMNLQTAFLSPPVAMSAFYLKGVSPPHVTLNQIFLGMLPFMGIQVVALVLLYVFPAIGLWLPQLLYK